MTPASDHVQGWTPAGLGKPVTRRHGVPAPVVARDQNQSRERGPFKPNCRLTPLLALHCRGASPDFLTRTAVGRCIGKQPRRADAILLPASARRSISRRVRRSRLQFLPAVLASGSQFSFSDHVPAKFADRFEAHVRHSKSVGFNATELMRGNLECSSLNEGIPLL